MTVASVGAAQSSAVWSGASARAEPSDKFAQLFDKLDSAGNGTVTKDQFTQAFSSLKMPPSFRKLGAEAVFAKLDSQGTGAVSKDQFVAGLMDMTKTMRKGEGRSEVEGDGDGDDFRKALQSARTTFDAGRARQSVNILV